MESGNLTGRDSSRDKWLNEGYRQFAEFGPNKISINHISKVLDVSRASFYHYFGDIDLFIDELLALHWTICEQFNREGRRNCKRLIPDLYLELGKYTLPLKFNLQLFHHRSTPAYNYLFIKSYKSAANAFALKLFTELMGTDHNEDQLRELWFTLGEAWYARLDPNDLSPETLIRHSSEIIRSVQKFMDSDLFLKLK